MELYGKTKNFTAGLFATFANAIFLFRETKYIKNR